MPAEATKRLRMRWIAIFLASLALLLSPSAARASNPLSPQVQAGKDIVIKSIRIIVPSTSVNVYGPAAQWYVITFSFTNSTPYDFVPQLTKFQYQTPDGTVAGVVTGSPDLIGIENPHMNAVLKAGATFDYTVAFMLNSATAGYLFYNPT